MYQSLIELISDKRVIMDNWRLYQYQSLIELISDEACFSLFHEEIVVSISYRVNF